MRKFTLVFLAISLSVISINWISNNTDWNVTADAIKSINYFEILFLILIYNLSFFLKILRFNYLQNCLQKSFLKTNTEAICIGYFVNLFLPLRFGDILRIIYLKRKNGFPAFSSILVITTEKLFDVTIIFLIIMILNYGLINHFKFIDFLPNISEYISIKNFTFFIILIFVFLILILYLKKNSSKFFYFFNDLIYKIKKIMYVLKKPKVLAIIFLFSISTWFVEGLVFYQAASYLNLQNPMILGFLSLCFVALSSSLPSSPAGVGVFEASVIFAVMTLSENMSVGLSFAIIVHVVQFFSIILISLVVFIFGKYLFTKKK